MNRRKFLAFGSAAILSAIIPIKLQASKPNVAEDNLHDAMNPPRSNFYRGKRDRSLMTPSEFWNKIKDERPVTFGELVYADNDTYCLGQQWMVFGWVKSHLNFYEEFLVPCSVSKLNGGLACVRRFAAIKIGGKQYTLPWYPQET